jgi:transketolase
VVELADKWRAFGWTVVETDGHDHFALYRAFAKTRDSSTPTAVIAHTRKGYGVRLIEDDPDRFHCGALTDAEYRHVMEGS